MVYKKNNSRENYKKSREQKIKDSWGKNGTSTEERATNRYNKDKNK